MQRAPPHARTHARRVTMHAPAHGDNVELGARVLGGEGAGELLLPRGDALVERRLGGGREARGAVNVAALRAGKEGGRGAERKHQRRYPAQHRPGHRKVRLLLQCERPRLLPSDPAMAG